MSTDEAIDSLPLSRVLAKRPGFYRTLRRGNDGGILYDKSSLPYLIEEFVACAVVDIAITASSPAAAHLDELPPVLRSRVVLVDEDGRVRRQMAAILEPVASEFLFEFKAQDGTIHTKPNASVELRQAIGNLHSNLYDFLLGAEYRLQVDVDLAGIQSALEWFRTNARSAEARSHLASLQGALRSYKPVSLASVALSSVAQEEQTEMFKRFVEDATYQHVSRGAGLLGVPEDGDRAVVLIARGLKRLVQLPLFKPVASLTSKAIAKASPVDVDTASLVEALLPKRYLPPIVPLGQAYSRAEALWLKQRGEFVESQRSIEAIGEGWEEVVGLPQPSILDFTRPR